MASYINLSADRYAKDTSDSTGQVSSQDCGSAAADMSLLNTRGRHSETKGYRYLNSMHLNQLTLCRDTTNEFTNEFRKACIN